jgi:hypothetical protein
MDFIDSVDPAEFDFSDDWGRLHEQGRSTPTARTDR